MEEEKDSVVKYDGRLTSSLGFVCKILRVTTQDFASLALSNLLLEELDWLEHNHRASESQVDSLEIKKHRATVGNVKFEANSWVIK